MNRRGFLGAILAAGVAPAFVGSSVLMPVKRLITPDEFFPIKFHNRIWYTVTVGSTATLAISGPPALELWAVGGGGGGGSRIIRP